MKKARNDTLVGISQRLEAHRCRLGGGPANADAAVDLAMACEIIDTFVFFADHGKVPETLLTAVANRIEAVRRRMVHTQRQRGGGG